MNRCQTPKRLVGDELLLAAIDPQALTTAQQAHLDQCPVCRTEVENELVRFEQMGATARRLSPAPNKAFRLPQSVARQKYRYRPRMLAFAALAILVLAVVPRFYRLESDTPLVSHAPVEMRTAVNGPTLMQEINALVENALPEHYLSLVSAVSDGYDDTDPLDLIVPAIGDPEPLT